ncbi:MAG: hypothetical protein KKG35_16050 [Proteobacteria bacterium]|nr:hypothetical protein [Pseudomonadota bacterium]
MRRSVSKLKEYLPQLIGRKVVKVLYTEPEDESSFPSQFLMELDNGATYEVYGRGSLGITGLCYYGKGHCKACFEKAEINNQSAAFADGKGVQFYSP